MRPSSNAHARARVQTICHASCYARPRFHRPLFAFGKAFGLSFFYASSVPCVSSSRHTRRERGRNYSRDYRTTIFPIVPGQSSLRVPAGRARALAHVVVGLVVTTVAGVTSPSSLHGVISCALVERRGQDREVGLRQL